MFSSAASTPPPTQTPLTFFDPPTRRCYHLLAKLVAKQILDGTLDRRSLGRVDRTTVRVGQGFMRASGLSGDLVFALYLQPCRLRKTANGTVAKRDEGGGTSYCTTPAYAWLLQCASLNSRGRGDHATRCWCRSESRNCEWMRIAACHPHGVITTADRHLRQCTNSVRSACMYFQRCMYCC